MDINRQKNQFLELSGSQVRDKMFQTLENLFREKKILEHGDGSWKKISFCIKWR